MEEYPDNSLIIFENSLFHGPELGYSFVLEHPTDSGNMVALPYERIIDFRKKLISFCDFYVNDNVADNCFGRATFGPHGLTSR